MIRNPTIFNIICWVAGSIYINKMSWTMKLQYRWSFSSRQIQCFWTVIEWFNFMLCWIKSVKVGGGKCYLDRKNQRKGCVKLGKYLYVGDSVCKCFTYVTKTIANLTTYSRKLGDGLQWHHFFWDWLIPTQFKIHIFCHCQNQNNTSFLLDSQHSQLSFRVN